MSEFKEFDQQGSVPNKDTGSIISHAFEMFKGVFLYAFVTMIIYLIADFVLQSITGLNFYSNYSNFRDFDEDSYRNILIDRPGISLYYSFSGLLSILLSPLYVGLIYIANKFNTKIPVEFSDLFIGYRQNLGNILLYSLITNIILWVSLAMCFIPFLFVYPLFFLGYPILLFENTNAMDAISKTYNIVKDNYSVFLGTAILAGLITFSGILLCCIGIIFTYPFIYIAMYSAYCAYLGKPRQIIYNK
ncbi:beta-carotene 15,15'-monooxygenase [Chryseobacterium zhengzhouense]|uniref:Beta-carotene 15,15'-monooxygenase n=1 Tax=Chryseobacterium zhengzhouense TaxID=1636086 RepID=A0ABW2M3W4_9FLAO